MDKRLFIFSLFMTLSINGIPQKNNTIQKRHFQDLELQKKHIDKNPHFYGIEYVIKVSCQNEFERIATEVSGAIRNGYTNILVKFAPGTFFYKKGHLNLNGIDNPQLSIRIEGDDTRLVANGKDYTPASNSFLGNVDYGHCFLTNQFDYLDFDGVYTQPESLVEIVNEKSKLCRVKTNLLNQDCKGASIQLNEWYMVKIYPIIRIKGGYIYITATDLEYVKGRNCYNVNYDYGVSKVMPRYVVKNLKGQSPFAIYKNKVVFSQGVNAIHECTNSQFLVLYKNYINYFHLKGITFVGSSDNDQLLYIRNVKANKVEIADCKFKYIKSTILRCDYADNVFFTNNVIENCFGRGVWSRNDCNYTTIAGNQFYRTIKTVDQSSCVTCYSENFYIANNVFKDFGGMAISVGLKYTQKQVAPISGIIENNEIFYTSDYLDFMRKYSLIDGGAIYLSTHTDGIIVRYNYIHGFGGVDSKRSIYCDDGCYDTKIYGNVIVQPDDEQAVFEWYSSGAAAKTSKSNSGIDYMYNVIWGKYKLEERPKSDCVHGKNVIIYTGERPQNVLKNFAAQEEDVYVSEPMLRNSLKELSPGTMKAIMDLPTYQGMKKWFE